MGLNRWELYRDGFRPRGVREGKSSSLGSRVGCQQGIKGDNMPWTVSVLFFIKTTLKHSQPHSEFNFLYNSILSLFKSERHLGTTMSYTVTFVGATGGCTNACLTHLLLSSDDQVEYQAIALARTPSKLIESLKKQPGITDSILARKLTIVQGDGTNVANIKKALLYQSQTSDSSESLPKLVDAVVSGIGSYPVREKGTLMTLTIAAPNIARDFSTALIAALREIYSERPDIQHKPVVSVISTTGLPSSKEDVPIGMQTLYHWGLKVPHEDKARMENLLTAAYEKEDLFKAVVILRPTLLMSDGILRPEKTKTIKAGTEDKPAKGYLIAREHVGGWIWTNILLSEDRGKKWFGQKVTLAY
jgi:hypothetical protein